MDNFVIGLISGFIASILTWIVTTVLLSPKVEISRHIHIKPLDDGKVLYRMKIKNFAKFRMAYDITIYFRILYKGVYLNIKAPEIPVLPCSTRCKDISKTERLLPINLTSIPEQRIRGYNDEALLTRYKNGTVSFESFNDSETRFEVVLIAHDQFSSVAKRVLALNYSYKELIEMLKPGEFASGTLEIHSKTPIE